MIDLLFGTLSGLGPKKGVLDGVQITRGQEAVLRVLMPVDFYGVSHPPQQKKIDNVMAPLSENNK